VIPFTMNQIRDHGVYDEFDFAILSAEIGVGKPDEAMYQDALDMLPNVKPDEIIFIDDQERFLEPAKNLGMHVVQGQSSEQIIADVMSILQR
ncbi:MAG TPA: HAD-IA family hydrolase, partial [Candidatus Saccharimonadales bacterium]|nr:HAD-IA family hydrolase [Candidatus Saccharimonadales bacterium]